MGKRKQTTIRVDAELLQKAQDLGLNVSKVCENCLRAAVNRLEGYTAQTETNGGSPATQNPYQTHQPHTNQRVGSLARIGHEPPKLGVAGSNPVPPAT